MGTTWTSPCLHELHLGWTPNVRHTTTRYQRAKDCGQATVRRYLPDMSVLLSIVVVLAMLACLALIPLGLPGLWLIVATTLALVLMGSLSWTFGLIVAGVALVSEVAEFAVLKRFGDAYGGSRKAFWGAVIGGMAGLFVGVPVPIIGPMITAFLGTFVGAGLVTYFETLSLKTSAKVGWGMLFARTAAVALKIAVAVAVIAAVGVALLL
jgi:uncharacterized protein YqgC (DUF456 family)